ncbi:response regulator [Dechloromonas denitrificans]|uniref:ATP-binding protein n=1 Tax=Dechloromonas denitrificans TaxID=281362 RepID=UPI001CF87545|nr:ATP-binding protein [Dechloromonas denitrificans]UCV12701.1 response regulator [Dechloromonas denitrificans]
MSSSGRTPARNLRRLLLAGLLCSNALVIFLSAYSIQQSREQYEQRAEALTQTVASALEQSLSNSIDKIDLALRTVADELERQLTTGRLDEAAMNAFMARQKQRLPELEAFRVADAQGFVILGDGVDKNARISWVDRDYFMHHREHTDRQLFISKPVFGRVAKKYIVGFAQRYNYPDGRFAGVISAPIAIDHFDRILSHYDVGPHGTIIVRDANLGLISRKPAIPDHPAGKIGNTTISADARALFESGVSTATFHTTASGDGFQRTISFSRLSNAPIIAIVGAASEDYLGNWYAEAYKTATLAAGFLLLSLTLGAALLRLLGQAEKRQQALAEREDQLKTVIEAVPDAIQFKDGEGRWLVANSVCLKLFGLQDSAWLGLTDREIGQRQPHLAATLTACEVSDATAWANGGVTRHEDIMHDELTGLLHFEVIKVPLFDENGKRRAIIAVSRDISERKRNEVELENHRRHLEELVLERTAALMETEARTTHILNSSADGLYGIDRKGSITFINQAACNLLGYRAEDAIGRDAHSLFHHSRPDGTPYPPHECPGRNTLTLGQSVRVDDEVYWHADGHPIPVMYATHPILLDHEITGSVTSMVDISQQRATAEARERALLAAENLARAKSDFLANMSHEIRTPLNGVLGFAEIGQRHSHNPERSADAFSKILASGKRLLGVINDILDFSKIEAGKLRIEQTTVVISEVIEHAVELVRDRAQAKQIKLDVELADNLPATCLGDSLRTGQVLLNLLSNAVKFTETGNVTLHARREAEQLLFTITDTGIGMDDAQLGQLFDPFQQADASASRRFGGTGLGLAICKRILELMGGEIAVESQLGRGTTVRVSLPFLPAGLIAPSAPATSASQHPATKPLAGLRILLAEDDVINQKVLMANLIDNGAHVTLANNGKEAVDRVIATGRSAFDIVLMDIQMPEMDGYEAARRIQELAPELPIIAQTAHAMSDEREKCFAAGMVNHIAKPIKLDELLRLIVQHIQTD